MTKKDNIPAEIIPNLFLGSLGSALSKQKLLDTNITHIVSALKDLKAPFPELFTYKIVFLNDSMDQEIKSFFKESNEFIANAI